MAVSRGTIIALFGPDGSGKSTVAELLRAQYEMDGVETARLHWRPGVLPYRRDAESEAEVKFGSPHGRKLRGGTLGLLVLLYVVVDFIIGHYLVVVPLLRRGVVVVYERYVYDVVMDQARYGLRIPAWIRKFLAILVPVPEHIVFLDAPGEVLQQRKGELGKEEIDRQRAVMKTFLRRFRRVSVIDVQTASASEVSRTIHNIIGRSAT